MGMLDEMPCWIGLSAFQEVVPVRAYGVTFAGNDLAWTQGGYLGIDTCRAAPSRPSAAGTGHNSRMRCPGLGLPYRSLRSVGLGNRIPDISLGQVPLIYGEILRPTRLGIIGIIITGNRNKEGFHGCRNDVDLL